MSNRRSAACLLLVVLCAPQAGAQEQPNQDPLEAELTAEAIQARSANAQASPELSDAAKQEIATLLQETVEELARTAEVSANAASYEREAAAAPGLLATIREELAQPAPLPEIVPPEGATLSQIEQLVQRAEQELGSAQERFEQLRGEQVRRGERRATLDQQIATTKERLSEWEDALLTPLEEGPVGEARRLSLLAQRNGARAGLRAFESELANYEARRELLPARLDRADRRVTVSQRAVAAWQELAGQRRRAEADAATRAAERLRLEAARKSEQMLALAEENQRLAVLRSGSEDAPGTTAQLDAANRELSEIREQLNAIRERSTTVRAKVEVAGLTNSTGLLLRKELEALPSVTVLRDRIRQRQDVLSDLQYQLLVRGDERSRAGDVERWLEALLPGVAARSPEERADLERVGRELLTQRRDLLSALLEDYEKLFARLVELDTTTKQTYEVVEDYRDHIEERILWVRSVSGPATPDLSDAGAALDWLTDGRGWADGLRATGRELRTRWIPVLLGALAIFAVMFSRFWSRGRIRRMAEVVERDPRDSFKYTASAFLIVLARATAFPALLWGVGWALATPTQQPAVVLAAAKGLNAAAVSLFAYELLRQVIHPQGLGEVHFRWPPGACSHMRRHLTWFIPVQLLTVFLVTTLDHQRESDLWNDSLGRLAFVLGMGALAAFNQRVLTPSGPVFSAHLLRTPQGWLNRLRYAWYPLAVGLPIVLAGSALYGYYYTALRLEERLHAWLWLILGLVLANALFYRWLRAAKRKLRAASTPPPTAPTPDVVPVTQLEGARPSSAPAPAMESASETSPPRALEDAASAETTASRGEAEATAGEEEAESPEDSTPDDRPAAAVASTEAARESAAAARALALVGIELKPEGEGRLALPEIDAQTRKLFRSAMALAFILGTYLIWANVLPALRRLDQVQVYPELKVLSADTPAERPTDPGEGVVAGAKSEGPTRITLADVGLAIMLLTFTVVAAKNLPGLLEIVVLQRLPLDAGSRYAAITLARYVIVLVGVPLGLAQVGITWDSMQWLAAALTFGLAFGLQEIFANFVSGLIILFERPIRVGDVVTVHGTSGVVTRIRMRATTITDFDRKELIVPNKQFVTGEVVNWVLSDAVVRVVIPVGLGYGQDLDQARRIMTATARAHPLVLSDPVPSAQARNLGPSTFDLELWVFVASAQDMVTVRTDLIRDVHQALTSAGIDLPFPQQDVNLRSAGALIVERRELD